MLGGLTLDAVPFFQAMCTTESLGDSFQPSLINYSQQSHGFLFFENVANKNELNL